MLMSSFGRRKYEISQPHRGMDVPTDPRMNRDWVRRFAWAALPPALIAAGYALLPLQSWDYWWHLAIGRLIDVEGRVPRRALFLYTMEADAPSIVQPWLAQWILYRIHEAFGLRANLALRGVLVAGALWVTTWAALGRSRARLACVLVAAVSGFLALPLLDVRTSLFVLPLFVGLFVLGRRVAAARSVRAWLAAFPIVAALWANLHGSFVLPALLAGLFGVASLMRGEANAAAGPGSLVWGLVAAVSLAAPLVHPRGIEVWRYVYRVATDPVVREGVTEWGPTTLAYPSVAGPLFYVVWIGGAALMWVHRRSLSWSDAIAFFVFGAMAALQARWLVWFALAAPIVLSPALEPDRAPERSPDQIASEGGRWWGAGVAAAAVVASVALQPIWPWWPSIAVRHATVPVRSEGRYAGSVLEETPVDSLAFLREQSPPARMFHDERYAGFLLFHLLDERPRRIVFVDQRVELPGESIWSTYRETIRGRDWRSTFEKYDIRLALLNRRRQARLAGALDEARDWRELHRSGANLLYVRTDR